MAKATFIKRVQQDKLHGVTSDQIVDAVNIAFTDLNYQPWEITNGLTQKDIAVAILHSMLVDNKPHVILRSPVGSGKSIIACVCAYAMTALSNYRTKQFLLSPTKALADQYGETFANTKSVVVAVGADNFACLLNTKLTGSDCRMPNKPECLECGFYKQQMALVDPKTYIVSANTSWGMSMTEYSNKMAFPLFSAFDEAHLLFDTYALQKGARLSSSEYSVISDLIKKTSDLLIDNASTQFMDTYKNVVAGNGGRASLIQPLVDFVAMLESNITAHKEQLAINGYQDAQIMEELGPRTKLKNKVRNMLSAISAPVDYAEGPVDKAYEIQPITPGELGFAEVNKARYTLYMSGTLSLGSLAEGLGIDEDELELLDIPFNWDPARRPVVLFGDNGYINARNMQDEIKLDEFCNRVATVACFHMKAYNESGIIIPTSFSFATGFANAIESKLPSANIFLHNGTDTAQNVIANYTNAVNSGMTKCVLIVPGAYEGINAKDDLARFVILPKTPFASMGNPRTKALADKFPVLYETTTTERMMQAFGRGMRHANDYCVVYVMDTLAEKYLTSMPDAYKSQFVKLKLGAIRDIISFTKQMKDYLSKTK